MAQGHLNLVLEKGIFLNKYNNVSSVIVTQFCLLTPLTLTFVLLKKGLGTGSRSELSAMSILCERP